MYVEQKITCRITIMMLRLRNCQKCQGDLALDGDEWHCLQCGRYYYPENVLASSQQMAARLPIRKARAAAGLNGAFEQLINVMGDETPVRSGRRYVARL